MSRGELKRSSGRTPGNERVQGGARDGVADSLAAKRVAVRKSFRSLENAPVGILVVHGRAHTVVYANDSFRESSGLTEEIIAGRPVAEVLANPASNAQFNPPGAELVALLDQARNGQEEARGAGVNVRVDVGPSASVSVVLNPSIDIGAETADGGVWRCMIWPVRGPVAARIDELVVEIWHACEGEASLTRRRQIAERMLLSALREQTLSEENVRLYDVANDARAAAEVARLRAEAAQHEAESANAAKAQFLANMSHELRTPLNAIGGYAQLMEMGLRGAVTEEQIKDLGRIQRSQAHLLGLINAVLNYAKLEAGQVVYATQTLALDDLVVDAESLVHPQLDAKGLRYRHARSVEFADVPGGPPVLVKADAEKLRQILLNLLTNAIKFTASGGDITVACQTVDESALVTVSDTGPGIPADKLQTIFDPFVQIGQGLSSTDPGVGLGLAISRDLARGMGGDLMVESIEGEGSTFTVVLPLASGSPED